MVFPSYGCVRNALSHGELATLPADRALRLFNLDPYGRAGVSPAWPLATRVAIARREVVLQANMEVMLLTARRNRPVNTVYNARLATDCAAEERAMQAPLQPGVGVFLFRRTVRTGCPPMRAGSRTGTQAA